jgi:ABC-type thiamin/hydroxymethylpyrimidine transport system permease subunit
MIVFNREGNFFVWAFGSTVAALLLQKPGQRFLAKNIENVEEALIKITDFTVQKNGK